MLSVATFARWWQNGRDYVAHKLMKYLLSGPFQEVCGPLPWPPTSPVVLFLSCCSKAWRSQEGSAGAGLLEPGFGSALSRNLHELLDFSVLWIVIIRSKWEYTLRWAGWGVTELMQLVSQGTPPNTVSPPSIVISLHLSLSHITQAILYLTFI